MTLTYFDELKAAIFSRKTVEYYFPGQAVSVPGTAMYNTLKDIDPTKRLSFLYSKIHRWGCHWYGTSRMVLFTQDGIFVRNKSIS